MCEPRGTPASSHGAVGKIFNRIRNARSFSVPARHIAQPIVRTCDFVAHSLRTKIWVNGAQVVYGGFTLTFPPGIGVHFATSIYWNGDAGFEPEVWRVLSSLLRNSERFADVGANIGLYSVLSRKLMPAIDVVAFEPVSSLAEKHRAFVKANSVGEVRLIEGGLSDSTGAGLVFLPVGTHVEEEQTASVDPSSWQAHHPSSTRAKAQLIRFDDYCESNNWWPDVVKIDVEGHEIAVLEGAQKLLDEHRPAIVCEVLRDASRTARLREMLHAFRYTSFAIVEPGLFAEDRFPPERPFEYYTFLPGTHWPQFLPMASLRSLELGAHRH
jgi:FkbM family methyltransferase